MTGEKAVVHDGRHDALFQALIATAVDGIMVIDERGIVQVYNKACEQLFLYAPEEVIGRNVKMLMPEPYRKEHDGYIHHYKETGERRIIGIGREVVGRRKDGTVFPMYLSVGEGRVEDRRIFVGILHDLTAIRAAAEGHEKIQRELAAIVSSSEDAIISKTLDGVITSWNAGAERIFGYMAQEMIGQPIALLFPDDRLAEENLIVAQLKAGQFIQHYETVRRRRDGTDIDVSLSVSPLYDEEGRVVGASKIARDITERKATEARLRELQSEMAHVSRLSAMGQLSSGLAHELNQPLTATANYINTARKLLETGAPSEKLAPLLGKASDQIQRAGQIIRRLREFVEKRQVSRSPEDINDVVEDAVALSLVASSDVNVELETSLAPNLPPVMMDRVQIQQVLVNLIRNAIEAMQGMPAKKIVVSTRAGDAHVDVAVADTGPGIPDDVAQRLFQPFVTTKSTGMGIGLMICRSIMEAHGGNLSMTRRPEGGTIFRFQLPVGAADDES
ncbi:MAG TPA: PAS domain S-box protein [Rhizomicrobium sp.]